MHAAVGQLLLTHFSPAVVDPWAHAAEVSNVFANTTVGRDHLTLRLRFAED